MTPEELAKLSRAQHALRIVDIFQRRTECSIDHSLLPTAEGNLQLAVQLRFGCTGHRVIELLARNSKTGEELASKQIEFTVVAGARFLRPDDEPEVAGSGDTTSDTILAVIQAEFAVVYSLVEECEESSLTAFGVRNAGLHVWPFWRDYLNSQCGRMRLPPVLIGMYRPSGAIDDPARHEPIEQIKNDSTGSADS